MGGLRLPRQPILAPHPSPLTPSPPARPLTAARTSVRRRIDAPPAHSPTQQSASRERACLPGKSLPPGKEPACLERACLPGKSLLAGKEPACREVMRFEAWGLPQLRSLLRNRLSKQKVARRAATISSTSQDPAATPSPGRVPAKPVRRASNTSQRVSAVTPRGCFSGGSRAWLTRSKAMAVKGSVMGATAD